MGNDVRGRGGTSFAREFNIARPFTESTYKRLHRLLSSWSPCQRGGDPHLPNWPRSSDKEYCTRFAKSDTNYYWYYYLLYSPELIVFEAWSLASSPSAWFAVRRPTQIPVARFSLPYTPIRQINQLFVNHFVNVWKIYDDNKTIHYIRISYIIMMMIIRSII